METSRRPDLSLFDLSGRKALVTGGATGIGYACAVALARAGADVAIVDMNEEQGTRAAAQIRELGGAAMFASCNVADGAQITGMVDAVVRRFGRLDIAVNNAGIFRPGQDETQPKEDWDQVIGVNLTGTWLCARAQMQQMIRQQPVEGKIINIGSIAATTACSNGAYDAAKAGVVHLTRTLALRWGSYNINVNCVSPGYVGKVFGKDRSPEECKRLREVTPLGAVQKLEDLHGAIVFLASRASDYLTGQNLIVDGGHTLSTWVTPLRRNVPARGETENG